MIDDWEDAMSLWKRLKRLFGSGLKPASAPVAPGLTPSATVAAAPPATASDKPKIARPPNASDNSLPDVSKLSGEPIIKMESDEYFYCLTPLIRVELGPVKK